MKKFTFDIVQFGYCIFTVLAIIAICDFSSIFSEYSEYQYGIVEIFIHLIITITILFLYYVFCKLKNENTDLKRKNETLQNIIFKSKEK